MALHIHVKRRPAGWSLVNNGPSLDVTGQPRQSRMPASSLIYGNPVDRIRSKHTHARMSQLLPFYVSNDTDSERARTIILKPYKESIDGRIFETLKV